MGTKRKRWEEKSREVNSIVLTRAGKNDISTSAGFVKVVSFNRWSYLFQIAPSTVGAPLCVFDLLLSDVRNSPQSEMYPCRACPCLLPKQRARVKLLTKGE